MRSWTRRAIGSILASAVALSAFAQKPGQSGQGGGGGGQANQNSSPSGSGLTGLSWSKASWTTDLSGFPHKDFKNVVVACYTLKYGNSSTLPLLLEPAVSRPDSFVQCTVDSNGNLTEKDPSIVQSCQAAQSALIQREQAEITTGVKDANEPAEQTAKFGVSLDELNKDSYKGVYWAQRDPFDQKCSADNSGKLSDEDSSIRRRCDAAKDVLIELEQADISSGIVGANLAERQTTKFEVSLKELQGGSYKAVFWSPCSSLTSQHPLLMGQSVVVAIAPGKVILDRVKVLNINVGYQQGSSINPTPVRASFTNAASSSTNLGVGPYYLTWPNQVPGDTIATVAVNAIYTPVIPGDKWLPQTFYPAGSIVTSPFETGHYYMATVGGVTSTSNTPPFAAAAVAQIYDGAMIWTDLGNSAPQSGGSGGSVNLWSPTTVFNRGQTIFDPYNGHYYTAAAVNGPWTCSQGGVGGSGTSSVPCGTSGTPPSDPFSLPAPLIQDGTVLWADRGTSPPAGPAPSPRSAGATYAPLSPIVDGKNRHFYQAVQPPSPVGLVPPFGVTGNGALDFTQAEDATQTAFAALSYAPALVTDGQIVWGNPKTTLDVGTQGKPWKPISPFSIGDHVLASNGFYYQAANTGNSGPIPTMPYFAVTGANRVILEADSAAALQVIWEDLGSTTPQGVGGGQPADQTVSLLNLQYSQSHSLSFYNLASGVAYSLNKSKTFGCGSTSGTTCVPVQTGSTPVVDPVLLFTLYPYPWDAEARCPHNFCLPHLRTNPPGFSFGLSLSSPSSSFHAGVSFEVLRNLQIFGGANWAKETTLPSSSVSEPMTTTGSPVTIQKFFTAPSFGLTLNISGFIQGLFGGGGGAGGGAASSSKGSGTSSTSQ